ncbi:unnamed protein product [Effrenium voratum]|nr:unnamed protein product [Effrenium voratum]
MMQGPSRPMFVRPGPPNGPGPAGLGHWQQRTPPGQPGRSVASPTTHQVRGVVPNMPVGNQLWQAMPTFQPGEEDAPRSPGGSLVSSVATLPAAADQGSSRWGAGINMQEALATMEILASRVNESLEHLPSRLDEATSEFRADTSSLRAEIQALSEDVNGRIAAGLRGERDQRQDLSEEVRGLGRDLREQLNQEVERLRDSVMREMRERMDGQKVLREEVQLQQASMMRLSSRVEDSFVELRTEMPRLAQEHTVLREELQRLQEAVGTHGTYGLQARLESCEQTVKEQKEQRSQAESDLRRELRELQQSSARAAQQAELQDRLEAQSRQLQEVTEQAAKMLQSLDVQKEALERGTQSLQKEQREGAETLRESLRRSDESLRQLLNFTDGKQSEAIAGLERKLEECRDRLELADKEAQKALSLQIQGETKEVKCQLQEQLTGAEQSIVQLQDGLRGWAEQRIKDSEVGTQSWVEASVAGRVTALDKLLKKEMAERASTNEQILGMITHNSERWCQLQAKFDEVLIFLQKGMTVSGSDAGGQGRSDGALGRTHAATEDQCLWADPRKTDAAWPGCIRQAPRRFRESREEFFELVKSIGESRSKQEEDKIIVGEIAILKQHLSGPNISAKKMKEYMIRAVYAEMLGHDASFAYIHAVKLTHEKNLFAKRIGYLTCNLFLHRDHELMLLLINTMQRDLQSANHIEVCSALASVCRLVNVEMIPAISPLVFKLLNHPQEAVRKKAVIAVHKFFKIVPETVLDQKDQIRKVLCDPDPSVMGASLHVLCEIAKAHPAASKDLVPSFVSILKQITEHRLPRDFDYHRMPAPWLQVKLLSILGVLGTADKATSEHMYEILQECMRRADSGVNVGYAIIYECVKCITKIFPDHGLLELAASNISRFISSENHNLRYLGVTGLAQIVQVSPAYAAEHQMVVVDCLEDPDETLKRKTLDLLFRMTNPQNVVVVVDKLSFHLRTSVDSHLRRDLAQKITSLAERFAPDNEWYVNTMNTVFELSGELVPAETAYNLMRLVAEGTGEDDAADNAFRVFAVNTYLKAERQMLCKNTYLDRGVPGREN